MIFMKSYSILAFIAGAGIGAAISYFVTKDYYEGIIQDEIDSVKEAYGGNKKPTESNSEDPVKISDKPDLNDYYNEIERNGYTDYAKISGANEKIKNDTPDDILIEENKEEDMRGPKIITEDQFNDEHDDYDKISLTYYSNGVLVDDQDIPIDEPDLVVGFPTLNMFGDDEVNVVHVRNDILTTDYEITRDFNDYEGD